MSIHKTIAIIMGSAVSADGTPGEAMRRRVGAALQLRTEFSNLIFIPTGGAFPDRPCSEAEAMKDLLIEAGVAAGNIILENKAQHTLQNITNTAAIIKKMRSYGAVIVCSDNYHIPRSRILLHLMGISTIHHPMPSGRQATGWIRWTYFWCREAIAIPIHVITLLTLKAFRKGLTLIG
jgi:uncharacterized SAM-binding protein YcdF (DUF218 family)